MKFFDMFSGVGGFHLGIIKAHPEWQCVGYCEIDKYANSVYKYHFPEVKNYGNATKIKPEELPAFDILCGGFPCQDVSIAGKRKGLKGARSGLFSEIVRIAEAKRPTYLFLENVKGLLSSNGGWDFALILSELDRIGFDIWWQCLNSKNFGVPQNRERVFIIGHLRGTSGRQIFPIRKATKEVSGVSERQVSYCIDSNYYKGIAKPEYYFEKKRRQIVFTQERKEIREYEDEVPTLKQRMGTGGNNVPMVRAVLTPNRLNKRQHGRRFKDYGEPSFTLTGQDIHGVMLRDGRDNRSCLRSGRNTEVGFKGYSIRRLTPKETERLQAFPDDWTKYGINDKGEKIEISDTQRYKMMGNAVTVNVVYEIAKRLG